MLQLFCEHQWETVSDIVTESTFEMALRVTGERNNRGTIPHQLCWDNRKHIVILKCNCGEVKKIVTNLD